jgi:two-component system phosphate regulon response regulator PhoB
MKRDEIRYIERPTRVRRGSFDMGPQARIGRVVVSHPCASNVADAAEKPESPTAPIGVTQPRLLTKQQMLVLHYMFVGKTNHEIARIMNLRHTTVGAHVAAVIRKLDSNNRQGAIFNALMRRVIVVPEETEGRRVAILSPEEWIQIGRLRISESLHLAEVDGAPIRLPTKEFKLLLLFASRPGRVFTRDQIIDLVWGPGVDLEPRVVDAHITRLRRCLPPEYSRIIAPVKGVGYRFTHPVKVAA